MTATQSDWRVPMAMGVAVLAISSAAAVIKLAQPLSAEVIACLRVSVTALGLAVIARRSTITAVRSLIGAPRELGWTVLAGVCLAAHFSAWIASLGLTTVVRSVALVSTQPLWAGLLARALGDRAPGRLYLGTLIAVVGTLLMVDPAQLAGGGRGWLGELLALSAAVTAAAYLALGRQVHAQLGDRIPLDGYLVCVNVVAAACLGIFAGIRGSAFVPADAVLGDYLAILWLGLIPGIIGHGLLNWAVRKVPVHTVSLAILLEPAGSAVFAWLLLAETVGAREVAGAAVLLGGVAVGLPRRPASKPV